MDKAEELIDKLSLNECPEGKKCMILWNPNKMTKEIGMNPGKTVIVFKNSDSDSNMIICLDSTRYIIAKSIAEMIKIDLSDDMTGTDCRKTS
jgi:Fe2+ transport system protein FeoA